MGVAIAWMIWGVIAASALFIVIGVVLVAKDSLKRGDRTTFEAMEQWEAARNVTGHVERSA